MMIEYISIKIDNGMTLTCCVMVPGSPPTRWISDGVAVAYCIFGLQVELFDETVMTHGAPTMFAMARRIS